MNVLLFFLVGFMVSEIPRVSVFRHCLYSDISPIYKSNLISL